MPSRSLQHRSLTTKDNKTKKSHPVNSAIFPPVLTVFSSGIACTEAFVFIIPPQPINKNKTTKRWPLTSHRCQSLGFCRGPTQEMYDFLCKMMFSEISKQTWSTIRHLQAQSTPHQNKLSSQSQQEEHVKYSWL